MSWVLDNVGLIAALTVEHVRHSVVPIAWALALSLPLGWAAHRWRVACGPLVAVTGVLYTLPSLALLPLLPTVFGISALSELNLMLALAVYAVAILVRAVADGFGSVDPEVRRAAVAVGYGPLRRFWGVELPLAGPVILAGLRVVAVSTVALATVGILIGVTNLGYLFTNGFQRRIVEEILAGVVAVALVALVLDLVLVLAGRILMPWARGVPAGGRAGKGGVR
ncbi:ABC transporter permease [Microbacterium album]|uniref:ABC transporter permease n=1 Tax=Microbacterium album TaxID=2053191 RepID=A0A917IDH0_9MICO|nr:ABC transporter permease subunit [Microbacterium album]GGH38051.1 ABC transporter permease [Microbacterium album]